MLDGDPPVRGFLHRAVEGGDAIVLTHGAGSDARAPLLSALARAFVADRISVLRCDLPFRQTRPSGPPSRAGAERATTSSALAAGTRLRAMSISPVVPNGSRSPWTKSVGTRSDGR